MLSLPRLLTKQSQGFDAKAGYSLPFAVAGTPRCPRDVSERFFRLSHIGRDPDGHSGGALDALDRSAGCADTVWVRSLWATGYRFDSDPAGGCSARRAAALRCGALRSFIIGRLRAPATGSWPISTCRYSRDGRPCFVDCGGSHRADPQSRTPRLTERGVRSVARALAKCSSCGSPCFVGAEVSAIGGSHIMQSVDLIYRAKKISAEVDVDTCLNFIRGVF